MSGSYGHADSARAQRVSSGDNVDAQYFSRLKRVSDQSEETLKTLPRCLYSHDDTFNS